MPYAHIVADAIDKVDDRPPQHVEIGGRWTGVHPVGPTLAEAGWHPVVETVRPDDTATATTDRDVQLVDARPTVVWASRPKTASELNAPQRAAAKTALTEAARTITALEANVAFLASTPTATQVAAQVKALTRQVNGLLRYTVGLVHSELFDSTEGT